jgi:quinol-cytochrome oxidoreductase complex cytochrome b subunit
LGGISFYIFLVLTVTGILLMFYYRPTSALAYQDIKDLSFAVTLGGLLRNMHRWAAHLMVIVVILHMIRVFLTGAYKPPRGSGRKWRPTRRCWATKAPSDCLSSPPPMTPVSG